MKLFFSTMAIVMTALLAVSLIGCGGDDDDDDGDVAVVAAFASAESRRWRICRIKRKYQSHI